MHAHLSTAASPDLDTSFQPALSTRPATAIGGIEGDWLCAWCLHRVANEKDRLSFGGQNEFSFLNPNGIRFEIFTFSQAPGCRQVGEPTLQHTWFPGHAWSYAICGRCGQHLGWDYTGPHHFLGLIKNRLVRAVCVRN